MMGAWGKSDHSGLHAGGYTGLPPRQRCRVFRFFGFDMPGV